MAGFEKVNGKVVKGRVGQGEWIAARRGAMLGYTGDVQFSPLAGQHGAGAMGGLGGVGGMVGRKLAGEGASMMSAQGGGEVWYGFAGLHHHIVDSGNELVVADSDRVLCHDGNLQTSIVFLGSQGGIKGAVRGAMTGQGLFTTQFSGFGQVVLLAHGGVFEIPITPQSQVAVDPQAYVAHKGAVTVDISAKVGWRDAVGKGSGEAFQLKLSGTGTVYVQASEQKL